jgi:hypothetical protein
MKLGTASSSTKRPVGVAIMQQALVKANSSKQRTDKVPTTTRSTFCLCEKQRDSLGNDRVRLTAHRRKNNNPLILFLTHDEQPIVQRTQGTVVTMPGLTLTRMLAIFHSRRKCCSAKIPQRAAAHLGDLSTTTISRRQKPQRRSTITQEQSPLMNRVSS